MPLRLYRDDSYLTRFTAKVVTADQEPGGIATLELDRTAFYPTGGGQPHDKGVIAGHPVIDVREAGDGRILHLIETVLLPAGEVDAVIDWRRRFDHMQQHTGQHVLSRAFVEVAGAATRSFHLGESSCTIDLDRAAADEATVRRAESRANEIVFGDAPVSVEQLDPARAPQLAADMNLARELALKPGDPIRIIRIEGFDETPCGGTHVRRAGEVGAIAVRSWERFKGGARVSFVCGGRVVRAVAELGSLVDACVARLSARPADLPAEIARLQEDLAGTRRTVKSLGEALIRAEAIERDASARVVGPVRVLAALLDPRPAEDLQLLARTYASAGSRVALLAAMEDGGKQDAGKAPGGKATLVFARSETGVPETLKMGEILTKVCESCGGKGGGGAALARGGIPAAQAERCLQEALALISARLPS